MTDPSTMTDEELDKAIENPPVEEKGQESTPETPTEETTEEQEEATVEETPAEEAAPEEETPEERPVSRREQLRVQQLLKKYGPPPQRQASPQPEPMDYREAIDADDQVYQALESDRQAFGQAQQNR